MTRGPRLAFLALCFAELSVVRAEDFVVQCEEGGSYTLQISQTVYFGVQCPPPLELLPLPVGGGRLLVYPTKDSKDGVPLHSLLPGAGFVHKAQKPEEIHIPQIPPGSTTFFLRCEGHGRRSCYIQIKVEASRLGRNMCVAENTAISFTLQEPNEVAHFACDRSWQTIPNDLTKAFDASCSTEISLPDGVVRTSRFRLNDDTLTLQRDPAGIPSLCLVCVDPLAGQDFKCKMHFHFGKPPPGAAHAAGDTARSTCMLSLTIIAVSFLFSGNPAR